jgi:tetratricopeptide (TPR) repeat protein
MSIKLLFINTQNHSIHFEQQTLAITHHWWWVYALAAYKHLEEQSISPDDIHQLPSWEAADPKSIATSCFRHLEKMKHDGLELLTSPPGAATKEYHLNPKFEFQIAFDISLEEVRVKLKLHQPKGFQLEKPGINARTEIALGESYFERGNVKLCENHFWKAFTSDPSNDQKLEILAWLIRIKIAQSEYQTAQDFINQFHENLALCKNQQKLERPEREALVWIQTGRLELNLHHWQVARKAFDTAKRFVKAHHHREWGAILAGYSLVAQKTNKFDDAYTYALQSLEHYANAKWIWAQQAMLSNLGAICLERSDRFTKNPERETYWLHKAVHHFEQCVALCNASGVGAESAACEINLGNAHRRLGQPELAGIWLDRAYELATRAQNHHDLAMTHAETAELELQTGKHAAAITSLGMALALYEKIKHGAQIRLTQDRLEEVKRMTRH